MQCENHLITESQLREAAKSISSQVLCLFSQQHTPSKLRTLLFQGSLRSVGHSLNVDRLILKQGSKMLLDTSIYSSLLNIRFCFALSFYSRFRFLLEWMCFNRNVPLSPCGRAMFQLLSFPFCEYVMKSMVLIECICTRVNR